MQSKLHKELYCFAMMPSKSETCDEVHVLGWSDLSISLGSMEALFTESAVLYQAIQGPHIWMTRIVSQYFSVLGGSLPAHSWCTHLNNALSMQRPNTVPHRAPCCCGHCWRDRQWQNHPTASIPTGGWLVFWCCPSCQHLLMLIFLGTHPILHSSTSWMARLRYLDIMVCTTQRITPNSALIPKVWRLLCGRQATNTPVFEDTILTSVRIARAENCLHPAQEGGSHDCRCESCQWTGMRGWTSSGLLDKIRGCLQPGEARPSEYHPNDRLSNGMCILHRQKTWSFDMWEIEVESGSWGEAYVCRESPRSSSSQMECCLGKWRTTLCWPSTGKASSLEVPKSAAAQDTEETLFWESDF